MALTREIVEYDPNWPNEYKKESKKLKEVFGDDLFDIHHIGSTSVPNLKAKPIIDSLVIIRDIRRVHKFDKDMISLGYRVRGECLDAGGTPGRFYYSKNTNNKRTHQAHVCEKGHFDIKQKIDFRDYLRAHPKVASDYELLKEKLAKENKNGMAEYIERKDSFVKNIIVKAREWRKNKQLSPNKPDAGDPASRDA